MSGYHDQLMQPAASLDSREMRRDRRGRGGAEGAVRVCRAQEVAVTPEGRHGIPVRIKIAARLDLNTEGEGNK